MSDGPARYVPPRERTIDEQVGNELHHLGYQCRRKGRRRHDRGSWNCLTVVLTGEPYPAGEVAIWLSADASTWSWYTLPLVTGRQHRAMSVDGPASVARAIADTLPRPTIRPRRYPLAAGDWTPVPFYRENPEPTPEPGAGR